MLKYLSAYALLGMSKANPTKEDVAELMQKSGLKVDKDELDFVFTQIGAKSAADLMTEGAMKMSGAGGGNCYTGGADAATSTPAVKMPVPDSPQTEMSSFGSGRDGFDVLPPLF